MSMSVQQFLIEAKRPVFPVQNARTDIILLAKKGDEYVRIVGSKIADWSASEADASWEGEHDTKIMKESVEAKRQEIVKSEKFLSDVKNYKHHSGSFYTSHLLNKSIEQAHSSMITTKNTLNFSTTMVTRDKD
nr:10513_t:CDS:2 [Entrophospora candida]